MIQLFRLARRTVMVSVLMVAPCAASDSRGLPERDAEAMNAMSERIGNVVASEHLVTVGAALIRDGRLVWTGYFGAESPGMLAGPDTRFNVASITKLVTAHTVLRLVAQGKLSLDEPMAPHWIDPDIADDPRHRQLTARMALNHSSGFATWRFLSPGGKLGFLHDPGSHYGYSGEGIEYVARYAQGKLGIAFPDLVRAQVFDPLRLRGARLRIDRKAPAHIAQPVDEDGRFPGYFCRPGGWCRDHSSYSAADDLTISVPEFARFLIALIDHQGYDEALAKERDRVQTLRGDDSVVHCTATAPACPERQGYGLGVEVLDYGDHRVIGHGGSDWSEMSLAYAYLPARDGVILFVNAPNAVALKAMPRLIEALDPASPYLPQYREWAARAADRNVQ
jgi:CubicO group peptidase (beta-lactamase class C family)